MKKSLCTVLILFLAFTKINAQCQPEKSLVFSIVAEWNTVSSNAGIGIISTTTPFAAYAGMKSSSLPEWKHLNAIDRLEPYVEVTARVIGDYYSNLQMFALLSPETISYGGIWSGKITDWSGFRLKMGVEGSTPMMGLGLVFKISQYKEY